MPIDWQPLVDLIDRCQTFLITSHVRADCDAIGSEVALAQILEARGKQALIINGDEVPEHIAFMDPQNRVRVVGATAPLESLRGGFDAFIIVDTGAWTQLGRTAEVLRNFTGPKVVIDHHVSQDDMGAMLFKDSTVEATGRLILQLSEALNVPLTLEIAEPLFAAIATDTGWFRFNSVTADTYSALAKLTAAGVEPGKIFTRLYEQHSLPRLLLRGRILSHITPECDGRLMWTYVTNEDFTECDANRTDTEDSINSLLTVAGVEVAALFVELEPGVTKVSLRSRSDFDVRAVAEQFGGGGHRAAAGISYRGDRATAQQLILDALRQRMG
jgi:phosphoesterase RecJ-like protein